MAAAGNGGQKGVRGPRTGEKLEHRSKTRAKLEQLQLLQVNSSNTACVHACVHAASTDQKVGEADSIASWPNMAPPRSLRKLLPLNQITVRVVARMVSSHMLQ